MSAFDLDKLDALLAAGTDWPQVRVALIGRLAWLWHPWRTLRLRRLTADLQAARERASARVKARGTAAAARLSQAQRDYAVAQVRAGATDEAILEALELTGPLRDAAMLGLAQARMIYARDLSPQNRDLAAARERVLALRVLTEAEAAKGDIPTAYPPGVWDIGVVPLAPLPEADASDRA